MKTAFKAFGLILGILVLGLGALIAYTQLDGIPRYSVEKVDLNPEPTPERLARGRMLATLLCATCHLDPVTQKLTGKQMVDAPPEFGVIYSKNITQHPTRGIGGWTAGELAYLLRTGVDRRGQYLPPYMVKLPHLSDEDMASILVFFKSDDPLVAPVDAAPPGVTQPSFLVKLLTHVVFKKLPYPDRPIVAPPITDKVAHGRYLLVSLDCYGCHSADFKTMDVGEPEKSAGYLGGGNLLNDLNGGKIASANLTPDIETGIGKWSEADFVRAVQRGFTPDGHVLRYPMAPMPELSVEEIGAVYAYLRTVPPLRNPVNRRRAEIPTAVAGASAGKALYNKYSCVSCHAENGVGIADLTHAQEHFGTDEALIAWIKNAPKIKPATRMPAWEGIIRDDEFAPLAAYVRELGTQRR